MKLLTDSQREALLKNGRVRRWIDEQGEADVDFIPVVKLFTPDANCTWLLTEIDPDEQDLAFGLCDLGLGFPELGYVSLGELSRLRGKLGLPVERDLHFAPSSSIAVYARAAWTAEHIVEDEESLCRAATELAGIKRKNGGAS
jgi:hypothetical protein